MSCKIQWIDSKGKPTPDNNSAVGYVRCLGYAVEDNPNHKPRVSEWFPICSEHLKQLPLDGRWEFVGEVCCGELKRRLLA